MFACFFLFIFVSFLFTGELRSRVCAQKNLNEAVLLN